MQSNVPHQQSEPSLSGPPASANHNKKPPTSSTAPHRFYSPPLHSLDDEGFLSDSEGKTHVRTALPCILLAHPLRETGVVAVCTFQVIVPSTFTPVVVSMMGHVSEGYMAIK